VSVEQPHPAERPSPLALAPVREGSFLDHVGERPLRTRLGRRSRSCADASFAKATQASEEVGPTRPLIVHSDGLIGVERHTCCSTQAALSSPSGYVLPARDPWRRERSQRARRCCTRVGPRRGHGPASTRWAHTAHVFTPERPHGERATRRPRGHRRQRAGRVEPERDQVVDRLAPLLGRALARLPFRCHLGHSAGGLGGSDRD
jgi:hypothetical protein